MVYQLVLAGKYRLRGDLFNVRGIVQFRQVAAWTENLLFRAGKRSFYYGYMMLTAVENTNKPNISIDIWNYKKI